MCLGGEVLLRVDRLLTRGLRSLRFRNYFGVIFCIGLSRRDTSVGGHASASTTQHSNEQVVSICTQTFCVLRFFLRDQKSDVGHGSFELF